MGEIKTKKRKWRLFFTEKNLFGSSDLRLSGFHLGTETQNFFIQRLQVDGIKIRIFNLEMKLRCGAQVQKGLSVFLSGTSEIFSLVVLLLEVKWMFISAILKLLFHMQIWKS
ncbi:hypothetical protein PanWU01x14_039880 [Parasponia andersonii]|uniref:Uncharacterized protein n=1 Tax=Parasponia andersonii TaxID=3476 RepID=A0A2P5DR20_PARAD|nr:hypothetical protein PanWU01x14_039880 [Parasponia andersonii]